MTTCSHGSVTPRHCMWCVADDLRREQTEIESIRRAIKDQEARRALAAILNRLPNTGEAEAPCEP